MTDDADPTQRILVRLGTAGREQAWRDFLQLYAPVIQQVVRLFEIDADSAADCFLFVCEHLAAGNFRRLRKFNPDGPASFPTWLRAVVRNLCIDWQRKVHGRSRSGAQVRPQMETLEAGAITDPRPDPEMRATDKQRKAALRKMVSRLPAPDRLLIRLRFEQELTLDQIAKLTGLKDPQTADRRVRRILESMREGFVPGGKFRERSV